MARRLVCGTVLVWTGLTAAPAPGQDWRAVKVCVAGTQDSVWIVGESPPVAGGFPVIQMWHGGQGKAAGLPKQSRYLGAVSGEVERVTADAEALRVLFSNLSPWDYYSAMSSSPGASWLEQSDVAPLAWGGDAAEPVAWAVVETDALKAPSTRPGAASAAASGPAELPATSSAPADKASAATRRLTVLRLQNGRWQRLLAPQAADAGGAFWITGHQGRPYLFWREPGRGVFCSSLSQDRWGPPESVADADDVVCGWAGVSSGKAVFVAGRGPGDGKVQLHLYQRADAKWRDEGPVREASESLRIDPHTYGVAVGRGRLCVARPTAAGAVEFAETDIGVSPSVRFTRLTLRSGESPGFAKWQEALLLAAVLGILTAVMWARREQVARPAAVPKGAMLATVWRRVIAGMLDCIPAMLLAVPFAHLVLPSDVIPLDWNALMEQVDADPQFEAGLVLVNYAVVALYGLWCGLWEWRIARTPGKMLLGCQVLSLDGLKPAPRQVLWRNVIRTLMVGLGPPGWIVMLLTMVMVTRNRQTLGDVVAGTIVVMPGAGADGQ